MKYIWLDLGLKMCEKHNLFHKIVWIVLKICYIGYHGNGLKETGNILHELLFHQYSTIQ